MMMTTAETITANMVAPVAQILIIQLGEVVVHIMLLKRYTDSWGYAP